MKPIASTLATALLVYSVHAAEGPATFKVSEFTFSRPATWQWVPVSGMRQAQLNIPGAKDPAEVVFFYFGPGSAGGTQANVDRWFRQFQEPRDKINAKTEETTIANRKVTFVTAEGTYLSGMPGGPQTPKPNYGLAGAIVEGAQGSVFIKMTGPKDLVKSSRSELRKLIESGLK